METFNTNRFTQYAKYDLTVNRSFYRNMAITSAAIILAITVLGFLIRWIIKANTTDYELENFGPDAYATIGGTIMVLSGFCGLMSYVYAGCFNHPLRNKQSRISVLTLPATNLEKFIWHACITIVGGFLLLFASILVADGINFLFSLAVGFPVDHIYSITANIFMASIGQFEHSMGTFGEITNSMFADSKLQELVWYLTAISWTSSIWYLTTFVFGNAVKYRYNIVWTILAHTALQFIVSTLMIVVAIIFSTQLDRMNDVSEEQVLTIMKCGYWCLMAFFVATTALMWWGSWKLYKKAQITSPLNR